jgi:integrase
MRTRMAVTHEILGGKVNVYKRENSRFWQCSSFLNGKNHRTSTKEEGLAQAKDFAEDWYLDLKGKARNGELKGGKLFKVAAAQFMREIELLTTGERSPLYVPYHTYRLNTHILPFFGSKALSEITPGVVQEYRIHRQTSRLNPKTGLPAKPARNTLHQEIVTLRQILKTAERHGWIPFVPSLAAPFRGSGKVSHRAWFSPEEYKRLFEATRRRAAKPEKPRWKWSCEQVHDYVLFMANTGLRPDEAARLEFRDVAIVDDDDSGERILEIEVRGKRGVGFCKSMPGAVLPFDRLRNRLRAVDASGKLAEGRGSTANAGPAGKGKQPERVAIESQANAKSEKKRIKPGPTDRLFPQNHRELFNEVLDELNLKFDRDKQRRTAYSLRHSYICMRLMEGADIYQIAKNCRTSVEMIEKFYASHLKNTLDASAINVRKARPRKLTKAQQERATT